MAESNEQMGEEEKERKGKKCGCRGSQATSAAVGTVVDGRQRRASGREIGEGRRREG